MKRDELIKNVQSIAQSGSRDEADYAIRITLETLREKILGDEAKHLASQLSSKRREYWEGREGENGQSFSLERFYQRMSQKERVDPVTTFSHARAGFSVLNTAIAAGKFAELAANLSEDYKNLLPAANAASEVTSASGF